RNPEPETRSPKPETRSLKPETRNQMPEARNPKPETRSPTPEARSTKPEARSTQAAPTHATRPPKSEGAVILSRGFVPTFTYHARLVVGGSFRTPIWNFNYAKSKSFPLNPSGELTFGDPFQESGVLSGLSRISDPWWVQPGADRGLAKG
ncbi:hypothetical protein T484DRAFT_1618599, partial [Baffinella frigidus]